MRSSIIMFLKKLFIRLIFHINSRFLYYVKEKLDKVQWCSVLSIDGSEIGYFRTPNDLSSSFDMSFVISNHHIFCVTPQIICNQNKYEELLRMRNNIKCFKYEEEVENYDYHEKRFPFWKKAYQTDSPSYSERDKIDNCLYKLLCDNCDDLTSGSLL